MAQFSQSKEIQQWRVDLRDARDEQRKVAVKEVIRAMTYGKDVSGLFKEMVLCCRTNSIEIKKLVYLYLMNYARLRPEITAQVVSTFVRDTRDQNPIIRGIAIRSMSSLRVDKIVDHLVEPLRRCCRDEDAYVRKSAAIAIAKLFDLDPEACIDKEFIVYLNEMLTDNVRMVVANAVAALSEICSSSRMIDLTFKQKTVKILLAALRECTEWGQVYILDAIAEYAPQDQAETDMMLERVMPRLNHANSAVVLSAVKVLVQLLEYQSASYSDRDILSKMAGPLVTLLNNPPEIQYVAMRNISLIVQRYPEMLTQDIKMFFCKYDDPIYVKLEKVNIIVKLSTADNMPTVLLELKEYAEEVDVDFVRCAVRAIGRCAIKIDTAAQSCIDVLVELIGSRINYVVQEAVIVIKDIFRKYPNRYEMIIGILCESLDTLDEPEAKAAMIWIIGEYADRIENADELLELFVETFFDETTEVQLQVLTAGVKLFLKVPEESSKRILKTVLEMATEQSDSPDIRDRGYMYWRLIHENLHAAKRTILAEKEIISEHSDDIPAAVLDSLLENISMLASVYQKPPEMFVPNYNADDSESEGETDDEDEEEEEEEEEGEEEIEEEGESPKGPMPSDSSAMVGLEDFLGMGGAAPAAPPASKHPMILDGHGAGKGLTVFGKLTKSREGQLIYDFTFRNDSQGAIANFGCKFNKNPWGLEPRKVRVDQVASLGPGEFKSFLYEVQIGDLNCRDAQLPAPNVQIAIKFGPQIVYFQDEFDFSILFSNAGKLPPDEFPIMWETSPGMSKCSFVNSPPSAAVVKMLNAANVFLVGRQESKLMFSCRLKFVRDFVCIMAEMQIGPNTIEMASKSPVKGLLTLFEVEIGRILGATRRSSQADFFF